LRGGGGHERQLFSSLRHQGQLGIAAIDQWGDTTSQIFVSAPYSTLPDPRDRVLGYVDFRASMLQREIPRFTCPLGTMVQEVYATHPDLRVACDLGMSEHVAVLMRDIEAAKQHYAPNASWTAESVAYFMRAVLQGAFIFAKAKQNSQVAVESLAHLRRYLETLFDPDDHRPDDHRPDDHRPDDHRPDDHRPDDHRKELRS
jgi:TetR/AcrR family transcriptional repressor of nem operon